MKATLIVLLIMQSLAYAGPVCGNHLSTAESMACCEKGHDDGAEVSIEDSHASSCCADCDMGKAPAIEKQEPRNQHEFQTVAYIPSHIQVVLATEEVVDLSWGNQKFTSSSPPELFILNESFRI